MRVDAKTSTIRVRGAGIDAWIFHSIFSPSSFSFFIYTVALTLHLRARASEFSRPALVEAAGPTSARGASRRARARPRATRSTSSDATRARARATRRASSARRARARARADDGDPIFKKRRRYPTMTSASIARLRPTSTSASRRDGGDESDARRRASNGARARASARDGDANDRGTRTAGRGTRGARISARRRDGDGGDARGRGVELGLDERDRGRRKRSGA